MRRNWLLAALAAIVLAVLAFAWIDGGRRALQEIAVPVAIPQVRK